MTPLDFGLGLALAGAVGTVVALTIQVARLRRRTLLLDLQGERWHRRHGEARERLESLREEVAELGYVIHDGQRRWGFDLARWPGVAELVGEISAEASGRFLIEWAPGIGGLRESGYATDRVA